MIFKDISLKTPEENILYDDVLLHLAQQDDGEEVLRFWESPEHFVVLGRISNEEEDVKINEVRKDAVSVLRRSSGGGTVLQGRGCLNYSLILSKKSDPRIVDLRKSYQVILNKVIEVFKRLGVESMFCPISDIALVDNSMPGKKSRHLKKISGNAQRRSKKFICHHGTILYDFNLDKIERYLKIPRGIPEYRQGRSHRDFVTNVSLAVTDIKSSFRKVFDISREENVLSGKEQECLQLFLNTKKICVDFTRT